MELPSNYFKRLSFQNDVEFIAAFLSTTQTNNNTPPSKKRPAEDCSLVTPTSQLPCCGWLGWTHQKLIALSLKDNIDERFKSTGTVPREQERFPLARVFSHCKDYSEFFIESNKEAASSYTTLGTESFYYTIRASLCQGSSANYGLCPCCKELQTSLAYINRHANKEMKICGDTHVTAETLQFLGPENTATVVSAICAKKDGQIHNL